MSVADDTRTPAPGPDETQPAIPPRVPVNGTPRAGWWAQLQPLLLRLHFFAGVFVAPFVVVAALTGLLYTVTPQLEQVVYHDQLVVAAADTARPLSAQVAAARGAHPTGEVLSVTPPSGPTASTRVVFSDETVPTNHAKTVFVDPHTARVLGQVTSYGQWLGVRAWIDELHRTLHLGVVGRFYSELAASWLWVVVLGGLGLWVARRRARRRHLVVPDLSRRGRRRSMSWHATVGVWTLVGLLALSASGLTWSRFAGGRVTEIRSALDWSTPAVSTALPHSAVGTSGQDHHASADPASAGSESRDAVFTEGVGVDGALRTALAAGLRVPLDIVPPADTASAWTVAENKRSAPTRYDAIAVDPQTGAVVDRSDFADWPFMAKVSDWIVGAHMGILFGVPNQLLLAALAVGVLVIAFFGYRMWWQRRPRRGSGLQVGSPPSRGALRRLGPGTTSVLVALTVAVGWLVPLLGVSLLAFLAVDVILGARDRRRGGRGRQPR